MPLYEYRCTACGDVFEVIQKFSDEPLTQHAKCGGKLQRVISAPALQFKGTGWYVTDYGGNGSRQDTGKQENKPKSESADKAAEKGKDTPKSSSDSPAKEPAKSQT
jgi:putative FmdB family regulatory protein